MKYFLIMVATMIVNSYIIIVASYLFSFVDSFYSIGPNERKQISPKLFDNSKHQNNNNKRYSFHASSLKAASFLDFNDLSKFLSGMKNENNNNLNNDNDFLTIGNNVDSVNYQISKLIESLKDHGNSNSNLLLDDSLVVFLQKNVHKEVTISNFNEISNLLLANNKNDNFFADFLINLGSTTVDPMTVPVFTLFVFVYVVSGVGYDDSKVGNPYRDSTSPRYDYKKSDLFYGSRPLYVLRRMFKLISLTSSLNINLFSDWRSGNLQKNEKLRAKEVLDLTTKLGPTFIKLGQGYYYYFSC